MKGQEIRQFISDQCDMLPFFQGLLDFSKLKRVKHDKFAIAIKDKCHWVLLSDFDDFEYFNSLGVKKEEAKQAFPNRKVVFNKNAVQSNTSENCGPFTLYYATIRIHNLDMSMAELLDTFFTTNLEKNDQIVLDFYNSGKFHEISEL